MPTNPKPRRPASLALELVECVKYDACGDLWPDECLTGAARILRAMLGVHCAHDAVTRAAERAQDAAARRDPAAAQRAADQAQRAAERARVAVEDARRETDDVARWLDNVRNPARAQRAAGGPQ